jgi:hypothetical protein
MRHWAQRPGGGGAEAAGPAITELLVEQNAALLQQQQHRYNNAGLFNHNFSGASSVVNVPPTTVPGMSTGGANSPLANSEHFNLVI